MKIYTKDKEILDTGLIITFKNEPVIFELSENLKYTVILKDDATIEGQHVQPKVISNEELMLTLINFNNSLGAGNIEPLKLGVMDGKTIYLNFIVYAMSKEAQKTLQYTWFKDKVATDGK